MSDTTQVRVTLRKSDFAKLKELVPDFEDNFYYDDKFEAINRKSLITLVRNDNYSGCWDDMESLLEEHEIEFDHEWDATTAYDAGNGKHRLDANGSLRRVEVSRAEGEVLSRLESYKKLIEDNDLEELKRVILQEYNFLRPFEVIPLDAPNSLRFIKEGNENEN